MNEKYSIYSDFDIEMHKKTYVNYLEVIIDAEGKIVYAVPSHQEKAIAYTCEKLHVSRDQLFYMVPRDYYCDFLKWLCIKSGIIAVWDRGIVCDKPTKKQIGALRKLKMAGLYKGPIPKISEMCGDE